MIDKRLTGTVSESKKYIAGNVALQWCSLCANITMMTAIILSTYLVAVNLLCVDLPMALAALWVLPVALVIVGFSKKAQNYFTRKQNAALIAVADGVQECLETIRDLKSSKAELCKLFDRGSFDVLGFRFFFAMTRSPDFPFHGLIISLAVSHIPDFSLAD